MAATAALLGLAASAHATFPGANGKIAFEDTEDIDVFTSEPDGSARTNLTSSPFAEDLFPAWSPDGTKIAFASEYDIYTMNPDGSGLTNVSDHPAFELEPAWSPDGRKLAFTSDRDGSDDIFVMNADGSDPTNLTDSPFTREFTPAWSPDGSKIAFWSNQEEDAEIYMMNPDGSNPTNLTNNTADDYLPNWSPDGTKLVFSTDRDDPFNNEAYVMDADGGNPVNLTNSAEDDFGGGWSPDGTKITFVRNGGIYTMNPDGSDPTFITGGYNPDWQPLPFPGYARPRGATPTIVRLVPAFDSCTSPNAAHGPPFEVPSCNPPQQSSGYLTVGTPDADTVEANSTGLVRLRVRCIPPAPNNSPPCNAPGDQEDVDLMASITDVRSQPTMLDYLGELQVSIDLRTTDRSNGPGAVYPATAADTPLSFSLSCEATDLTIGSTCSAQTSADALLPGIVQERKRAVWQIGQVQVYDGGADGDADSTADNTLFLEQGLFVP